MPDYRTRIQTKTRRNENARFKNALFTITKHFPNIDIPGHTVDGSPTITSFTRHVYIIDVFKIKMLIKNYILNFEIMVLNIGKII